MTRVAISRERRKPVTGAEGELGGSSSGPPDSAILPHGRRSPSSGTVAPAEPLLDPRDSPSGPPAARASGDYRTRLFRSVLDVLGKMDIPVVAPDSASLGSIVRVRDVATAEQLTFEIVPLDMVDGSLERVTLASPIGQVLQDTREGDVVEVETPLKRRAFLVERVETIWELVERGQETTM